MDKEFEKIIFFLFIAFSVCCDFHKQSNIKNQYQADFISPAIKISNLFGNRDSIEYPGGKLCVTYYRFDSNEPVIIRNRGKYKKENPKAILNYSRNNNLFRTEDIAYLQTNEKGIIVLYFEDKVPVYFSRSVRVAQITIIKKWIVFWLKGKTYFVVHKLETKYTNNE